MSQPESLSNQELELESQSDEQSKRKFQFNKKLWTYFIEAAQPYFFPVGQPQSPLRGRRTRVFLELIFTLLIIVVSFTFFLTVGLTFLGKTLFTNFFETVAKDLISNIDSLLATPAPYLFLALLLLGGLAFSKQQRHLNDKWKQWSLLGVILFLSLVVTGLNVILSYTFRLVDNSFIKNEPSIFWQTMIIYGIVLVVAIPIIVGYFYVRQKLGLMWREWLTKHFLKSYFSQRAYYELDSNSTHTVINSSNQQVTIDNPDQRVTQDIDSFTKVTLSFLLDILDSILTLVSFTAVLYTISPLLMVGLLVYALVGNIIAIALGSPLIGINYEQLRLEANFRYGMVRVRDNAESIAFYRGEELEKKQVTKRLEKAVKNYNKLIIWQSFLVLFQRGYNFFTRPISYILLGPLVFAGTLDFGAIGQATFAFVMVLSSLSIITNQIREITEFAASVNRLGEFYEFLEDPSGENKKGKQQEQQKLGSISTKTGEHIQLENITLQTPTKRVLIEGLSVNINPNDNLLIMGASGSGKSSLLRAIAGLWKTGSGTIYRPIDPLEEEKNDQSEKIKLKLLFLPQRPYMILGTLREQLLYPNPANKVSDDYLQQILETVNLPDLAKRFEAGFNTIEDWENVLSLGEQQRVAFARVLISQPDYAILDEATSALDVKNEEFLYEKLAHQGTTYISVGHRPTLTRYHQQLLEILEEGNWQLEKLS
ncbi:MAG: ABC transporter ATP-binding protein/permease [Microcystaceae cyanobacterium]